MGFGKTVERRRLAAERFKEERGALSHGELEAYNSGFSTGLQTGYEEGRLRERKDSEALEVETIWKSMGFGATVGACLTAGTIWLLWMLDAL